MAAMSLLFSSGPAADADFCARVASPAPAPACSNARREIRFAIMGVSPLLVRSSRPPSLQPGLYPIAELIDQKADHHQDDQGHEHVRGAQVRRIEGNPIA